MSGAPRGPRRVRGQHLFTRELKSMMYAHGDVETPLAESVTVLEDLLLDFIIESCHQATLASGSRAKVRVDDFKFVLRKDSRKLGRIDDLIRMQKVITDARKQIRFDEKDGKLMGRDEAP